MKSVPFFLLFLFLFCIYANSQVITGKVYDKETGLPIENVNVYLNGTSYYSKTNQLGVFFLKVAKKINTPLIISHVSYETVVIDNPFEVESRNIFLIEKNYQLSEVVIRRSHFSREQLLKAFEPQFLGENAAGRSCKIQNKDDIDIFYDESEKMLYATNEKPIIIENKYLGYEIHCLITDFNIQYSGRSLNNNSIESVLLRCNIFLIDVAPNDLVIKNRREETYKSTLNYFFKSLATKTTKESKHLIYKNTDVNPVDLDKLNPVDPDIYFDITDDGLMKIIQLKPDTDIQKHSVIMHKFPYPMTGMVTVKDPTGLSSDIYFLTDEFGIDSFGGIDKKDYLFISGQMGNLRIGSALPLDYE